MAYQMLNIKEKLKQSRGSVAKMTRKKLVSRATSKHICSRITTRVFEKYRD